MREVIYNVSKVSLSGDWVTLSKVPQVQDDGFSPSFRLDVTPGTLGLGQRVRVVIDAA